VIRRSRRRLTWADVLIVLIVAAAFVADLLTAPPVPDPDSDPGPVIPLVPPPPPALRDRGILRDPPALRDLFPEFYR
jgi:hypothetical protein